MKVVRSVKHQSKLTPHVLHVLKLKHRSNNRTLRTKEKEKKVLNSDLLLNEIKQLRVNLDDIKSENISLRWKTETVNVKLMLMIMSLNRSLVDERPTAQLDIIDVLAQLNQIVELPPYAAQCVKCKKPRMKKLEKKDTESVLESWFLQCFRK